MFRAVHQNIFAVKLFKKAESIYFPKFWVLVENRTETFSIFSDKVNIFH